MLLGVLLIASACAGPTKHYEPGQAASNSVGRSALGLACGILTAPALGIPCVMASAAYVEAKTLERVRKREQRQEMDRRLQQQIAWSRF